MRIPQLSLFAFGALALAACGGNDQPAAPADAPAAPPAPVEAPAPTTPATPTGEPLAVTITPVGDEMKFAETEFTARPGQQVTLTFNNTATSAAMQHNVVVVTSEAAVNEVGQAALGAADTEYIPADKKALILAHTPLAAPGKSVTVTFIAPNEPGSYPYICTFPGHYMMMKGVMKVQ